MKRLMLVCHPEWNEGSGCFRYDKKRRDQNDSYGDFRTFSASKDDTLTGRWNPPAVKRVERE